MSGSSRVIAAGAEVLTAEVAKTKIEVKVNSSIKVSVQVPDVVNVKAVEASETVDM